MKAWSFDISIVQWVNDMHSPWQDALWSTVSEKFVWIPFYAVLLYFLYRKLGWKRLLVFAGMVALLITCTDQISVFFKNYFQRPRPCHADWATALHLVDNHCGGPYGFFSSHATNAFGLAVFLGRIFRNKLFWIFILIWAVFQAYSRVYLAVHYPSDVAVGAVVGSLLGWGASISLYYIYRKFDIR